MSGCVLEVKCFLHTALFSEERSVRSEETKWNIQYLLQLKMQLISFFWL